MERYTTDAQLSEPSLIEAIKETPVVAAPPEEIILPRQIKKSTPLADECAKHLDHPQIQKWIHYYTEGKGRGSFQRFLQRGEKYKGLIEEQLKVSELPRELYYLALIESGFQTKIRSRASAVGIWQFIKGTGKRYGLKVNTYVDERQDPTKATKAATRYLSDLYRVYQSWWLAIASYNQGEFGVMRAVMRKDTRDYFQLVKQKAIPRETRNYVPKFIAAWHVGENYQKYGFTLEETTSWSQKNLKEVRIPPRIRWSDLRRTGCTVSQLKKLNPAYRYETLHPRKNSYIFLPQGCQVKTKLNSQLLALSKARKNSKKSKNLKDHHRVRPGENLNLIAKRHGTTVKSIKKLNGLNSNRIYAGQRSKIPSNYVVHKVRAGESLYLIAKRYDTSVRKLRKLNNLYRSQIFPGQLIRVSSKGKGKRRV